MDAYAIYLCTHASPASATAQPHTARSAREEQRQVAKAKKEKVGGGGGQIKKTPQGQSSELPHRRSNGLPVGGRDVRNSSNSLALR